MQPGTAPLFLVLGGGGQAHVRAERSWRPLVAVTLEGGLLRSLLRLWDRKMWTASLALRPPDSPARADGLAGLAASGWDFSGSVHRTRTGPEPETVQVSEERGED